MLIGGEADQIPLLGKVLDGNGEPWLWLVECFNPSEASAEPLALIDCHKWALRSSFR